MVEMSGKSVPEPGRSVGRFDFLPAMVSDVLSIKITTGQTQINLTDLTDRVKQAEDRISLNENKLLAYEKDLNLRLQ